MNQIQNETFISVGRAVTENSSAKPFRGPLEELLMAFTVFTREPGRRGALKGRHPGAGLRESRAGVPEREGIMPRER